MKFVCSEGVGQCHNGEFVALQLFVYVLNVSVCT